MKNIILFILLFGFTLLGAQTVVKNVDAEQFKKYIAEKKYQLIDLRTDEEISKKGMIKDAQQINFFAKDAEEKIAKLDKNKTYLIYCAGGGRSEECAALMQKQNFKEVINLQKGYDDWKKKGFETTAR